MPNSTVPAAATGLPSSRGFPIPSIVAFPGPIAPVDLAAACAWATAREDYLDQVGPTDNWTEEERESAYCCAGEIYQRAINEPASTLAVAAAKARMLLIDLGRSSVLNNDTPGRLIVAVLRDVIALGGAR